MEVKTAGVIVGVVGTVIAVAALLIAFRHGGSVRPRPQKPAAVSGAAAIPPVKAENAAVSAQSTAGALTSVGQASTPSTRELPPPSLPPTARLASELANKGNATALDGAETYMWASINRETDVAAKLVKWYGGPVEGTWTYHTRDVFRSVPEPWQSQVKTPERLMAVMHENEVASFGAFEIKAREVIGPNDELIQVRWFAADGTFIDQAYLMRLTPIGWRREIHSAYLSKVVKQLQATTAQGGR